MVDVQMVWLPNVSHRYEAGGFWTLDGSLVQGNANMHAHVSDIESIRRNAGTYVLLRIRQVSSTADIFRLKMVLLRLP